MLGTLEDESQLQLLQHVLSIHSFLIPQVYRDARKLIPVFRREQLIRVLKLLLQCQFASPTPGSIFDWLSCRLLILLTHSNDRLSFLREAVVVTGPSKHRHLVVEAHFVVT